MKKFFFPLLLAAGIAAVATPASAQTIRRVNNTGTTGTRIYATVQAAHDAAANGDIIYLEPSAISMGSLTCTKSLTFIGNGYFLSEQSPQLQLDPRAVNLDAVNFAVGSAGSKMTGCTINATLAVAANNIALERNRITSAFFCGDSPFSGTPSTITAGLIRQNYIENLSFLLSYGGSVSGVLVSNNIIRGTIGGGNSTNFNGVLFSNNVIGSLDGSTGGGIDVDNAVLKNNIVTRAAAGFTLRANSSNNNLGAGTQFGTANGNRQNVSLTGLFVGGTTSTDGAYKLAPGSTAIGAGESGVDAGAFGGAVPYVQAGIPAVPTIYNYSQSVSGNTLNATISTRSNK